MRLVSRLLQNREVAVELIRQEVKLEKLPDGQQLVAPTVDQCQGVVVRDLLVHVICVSRGYLETPLP